MSHPQSTLHAWTLRLTAFVLGAAAAAALLPAAPAQAQESSGFSMSGLATQRIVGSGQSATERRAVGAFDAVSVSGNMKLVVRQAATIAVLVRADDNVLPVLETVVEGGTLKVRYQRGTSVSTRTPVVVEVDASTLKALSTSGSGDIELETFKTPVLNLSVSGSGDVRFKGLDTDNLSLSISGSGDAQGDGRASKLRISIAGSGDVKFGSVVSDEVRISIAGSGNAVVQAARTLEASIAGSGDVRYTGNATVSSRVAGSGSIKKL
jgi:carbon monoxide dehydrogenase subunit G